mmetsp:Transcript_3687/g.9185  ORF Transcript_3687/g.9185 Transcript_3687/m.9185 type:complete len:271 (-) Transcript_3687:400-1212(-)
MGERIAPTQRQRGGLWVRVVGRLVSEAFLSDREEVDERRPLLDVQRREIKRYHHHLVRIEVERVPQLETFEVVSAFGHQCRRAGIGGVHMQPHGQPGKLTPHRLSQRLYWVDGSGGGGADGAAHKDRNQTVLSVLPHLSDQIGRLQGIAVLARRLDASHLHTSTLGLFDDGRVGLVRRIGHKLARVGLPRLRHRPVPRRHDDHEHRVAGRLLNHTPATPRRHKHTRQIARSRQPVHDDGLELSGGWGGGPREADGVEGHRQHVAQHGGER